MHLPKDEHASFEFVTQGSKAKYIFAKRFSERDGSCSSEFSLGPTEFSLGPTDVGFVQGMATAGVDDATELLSDLRKLGTLDVVIS